MKGGETREIVVQLETDQRLDSFLAEQLEMSRSRIAQLIQSGHVRRNGEAVRKRDRPLLGDRIRVELPAPQPSAIEAEPIPLEIVYQDTDLLVIDKPPDLVVHPAPGHRSGTLVNALLHHVGDLSGIGGELRPGIVHRLDRDTSGLLLVAKHDGAHRRLADALRARHVRRRYLVAAWGHLEEDSVTVDAPIGRHPTDRKRMAVLDGGSGRRVRRALTHFRVRQRWRAAELLEAELETGRTHQIRVHLLHLGHPTVGDRTYGVGWERGFGGRDRTWAAELAQRTPRQFLHAAELRFAHPRTDVPMCFRSPLPPDLARVAEWAAASSGAI